MFRRCSCNNIFLVNSIQVTTISSNIKYKNVWLDIDEALYYKGNIYGLEKCSHTHKSPKAWTGRVSGPMGIHITYKIFKKQKKSTWMVSYYITKRIGIDPGTFG